MYLWIGLMAANTVLTVLFLFLLLTSGAYGEYKVYINVTKAPVVRTEE